MHQIAQNFDDAATRYDNHAPVQAQVAERLVALASDIRLPKHVLDLGCGTGFVTQVIHAQWPTAELTAFDISPAMLQETQRKVPNIKIVAGDAAEAVFPPAFDLIFSSMMLQWLPDPLAVLRRWRGWLRPQGKLFVALPVAGSFREWQMLCRSLDAQDGLWPLPSENFASNIAAHGDVRNILVTYPSAQEFVRRLKVIGAATPREGHKAVNPALFRRLLTAASRPFLVTYRMQYLVVTVRDSA